ncbi:MAG: acyl-CoA dehydrogenase family protein [Alphaproteobacteria bacterium]|jgi:alkylation response protein AidB-like acyl-CoA dehydrogenase|nr:acyl-CoA dehydrogenase family protein [Alphaproteobacteria bacterium]
MAETASTVTRQAGTEIDYLERARALAPVISGASDQGERDRKLPVELMDRLHEAGLFRLLLPRQFNGAEVAPPVFFEVIEETARHDASTAWCLCQGNGCAVAAAYLDAAVAAEIWSEDPRAVLAWGPGPGTGIADGKGYRVSGHWSFVSGGRHATWLGAHVKLVEPDGSPRLLPDGSQAERTMLVPAAETQFTDIWDVIGLLGTGSDRFDLNDHFVAHDHSIVRDVDDECRCDTPLYRFKTSNLYAIGFAATALGIARTMHEDFIALAGTKTPRMTRQKLSENNVVQSEVGQSQARLGSARAFVLAEVTDIWQDVLATGRLTVDQRMRLRLATTYAIHQAKHVGDMVYELAGATAIFKSSPLEHRFRDLRTVTQQVQGQRRHFETVGAYLLGQPADLTST